MKKLMIITIIGGALLTIIYGQHSQIKEVKSERDRYKNNSESLLTGFEQYKTQNDSLNAAKVQTLLFKIDEYEKYRAKDAAEIKNLKTENRNLKSVATAQIETISKIKGIFRDSIVYREKVDTFRCIDISTKWYELHGCADRDGNFEGIHINRDDLLIASTVKYGRFLGFLWKTKRVKDRQTDIVSKNPDTVITGFEFIEIER